MRKTLQPSNLTVCGFCCALLFLTVGPASRGQKIDRKRPAVYITFERFVTKTADEAHASQGARLKLQNNSNWPIYYAKWLDPALAGDVAMAYVLQLETGCWAGRRHVDVVTRGRLSPGKSVTFAVPREDFPAASQIYVEFNFSWELNQGERLPYEAVHRAYFLSTALPDWPDP